MRAIGGLRSCTRRIRSVDDVDFALYTQERAIIICKGLAPEVSKNLAPSNQGSKKNECWNQDRGGIVEPF